jgi:hypothetical protein
MILEDGASAWAVAKYWNTTALKTDAMRRGKGAVWTTTTTRQILERERNAGILMHLGAELPHSRIPAIVSREDWEAALAAIKGAPQGPRPQYLLGGLILCTCGATMHASTSVTARKGKPVYRSKIYRCRLYGFDKTVKHQTISLPIADEGARGLVIAALGFEPNRGKSDTPPRLAAIGARLAALNIEESRATELLVEGLGNAAQLKGKLKTLKAERAALEAERDAVLAEASESSALEVFRGSVFASRTDGEANPAEADLFTAGFTAWDALTMDQQRAIIRGSYRFKVAAGGRGMDRLSLHALPRR